MERDKIRGDPAGKIQCEEPLRTDHLLQDESEDGEEELYETMRAALNEEWVVDNPVIGKEESTITASGAASEIKVRSRPEGIIQIEYTVESNAEACEYVDPTLFLGGEMTHEIEQTAPDPRTS